MTDLARAHIAALRYLERGGPSDAFNVGTGKGGSVREVIACVEAVSGRLVPRVEGRRRPGDPEALVADARKVGSVLGWQAECSDLWTIVETAYRWHEEEEFAVRSQAPGEAVPAQPFAT